MTFQSAQLQLFLNGAWTDVPLLLSEGLKITRGHEPYGTWPRPTKIECTINNDSLNYDPSLPTATVYGIAGRNTQVRTYSNSNQRVWAEASSWTPDRTPEHTSGANRGLAWVDITAEGVLRRLGLWTDPLRSPMYRTISTRTTCIGHWPLEDDRDATRATATVSGAATVSGVTFGESESPAGAQQSVKVSPTSLIAGQFKSASSSAGWQVAFSMKLAALPPSGTYVGMVNWRTSNGYRWFWSVNNASYQFNVTDTDGNSLYSSNVLFGAGAEPNKWVTFRAKASASGGTVTIEPAWYAQGGALYGFTGTFTGTVGALRDFRQVGDPATDGSHISHIFGVTGVSDSLLSAAAIAVFNGYAGEVAGGRFNRLCAEQGVAAFFIGDATQTVPMGPQQADTFMSLLTEIRATDDCRIDDERFTIGLTMTTRRGLYGQSPALTLTYPSQVAIPFTKLIDDAAIRNEVTVKNRLGGETTVALLTGAASIQPPPAGVGEVKLTVDVNVADDRQMDNIGTWWLAKSTLTDPRFASVTVDLLANPGLASAAMSVREGSMIRVTGYNYDPIDLLVVGIVEKVGPGALWSIQFQTEPYEPYRIGTYDDGTWRWDARTSTLSAGATSAATSLTSTCTDPTDVWTTSAGSLPMDLTVSGEVVRVTAVTAAGAAPTYTQTLTVTRAINGVVKALPAGAEIHVHDYRRWGL